ncbi:TRZ/ATZ family hydrolase [Zooshikella ganghwensis]|uniref:5-methylthioadenosine/S-adenosylhomocysteine deaminase n=1 Tax=Zooshikella ganghwensis TaxID=202772 RepID=A0A4V1INB4_9GAMM|nr:TRZ/ATZ family hydrolase [Zooshikella ganghwensis]RDH43141.1 TRZ/ATZ family hydrolase [Zooshikella ganghwensis]
MSEKKTVDTVIEAGWVIPVTADKEVLKNHALVINDGTIVAITPNEQVLDQFQPANHQQLPNHALIPGFINTHCHAAMSFFRGKADDLPLMTWLNEHIWPAESQWVSAEFVHDGTQLAIAEMLRCGTTTFSDMYFFPEVAAKVALDAKIRSQISFPIMDFPTPWAKDPDEYLHKGLEVFDQFRHQSMTRIMFGPHAPYTVSDEPLKRIATLSEQLDAAIQMHIHETPTEVNDGLAKTGKRPLQRLHDLGLLSPRLQCVHMTQITEADIQLLQQTGAHVVHCPESNLKLASGFSPVDQLLKAGINVSLGTDGAASNNDLDILSEMRTAALLAKAVAEDAEALSAHEALAMATINGAKTLGIDDITGSLEVNKAADITAINLDELENLPMYHPVSQIVYTASSRQVTHVWVNGHLVLNNRELTTLDIDYLKANALRWKEKIITGK